MKVLILCIGTRGDVEPMLALGKALLARGHAVTLCGPDNCASWVRDEHGVAFAPLGLDFKVLMQSPEVRGARGGGVESAIGKLVCAAMPAALRAASGCAAAAGVDLVLCSCAFPGGPDVAEAHGAALVTAALAPVFPTRSFPFFLASAVAPVRCLNRATYVMPAMARAMHGAALVQWRREALRLTARAPTMLEMGCRTDGSVAPRMCCVSPAVIARPDDWDDKTHMTGYWRLDDPAQWQPGAGLAAFLAGAGAQPVVYIGFGSMTALEPAALAAIVLPAVRDAGVRAVLQLGWSGAADAAAAAANPDVFYLDAAPHAKLFPLVAAVVHHGGAGTTAAGLAAGRPTLVCPIGADQHMWAAIAHRELGVGPPPVALARLTPALLAARLRALVTDAGFRARAAALAAEIAKDDGLARAVEVVEAEGRRCGKILDGRSA